MFKKITPAMFGLALLCFMLPWTTVSCQQQPLMRLSGANMTFGAEYKDSFSGKSEAIPGEKLALFAALALVAGLVGSAAIKRKPEIPSMVCGFAAAACLLALMIKINHDVAKQGEGVLEANFEIGFFLSLLLPLGAGVVNLLEILKPGTAKAETSAGIAEGWPKAKESPAVAPIQRASETKSAAPVSAPPSQPSMQRTSAMKTTVRFAPSKQVVVGAFALLLVVLGAGGYFVYSKKTTAKNPVVDAEPNQSAPEQSSSPEPSGQQAIGQESEKQVVPEAQVKTTPQIETFKTIAPQPANKDAQSNAKPAPQRGVAVANVGNRPSSPEPANRKSTTVPSRPQADPAKLEGDINRSLRSAGLSGIYAEVSDSLSVVLKGSVESDSAKGKAVTIAKSFHGISKVKDMIFVVEN